jgi:hypothetical protein
MNYKNMAIKKLHLGKYTLPTSITGSYIYIYRSINAEELFANTVAIFQMFSCADYEHVTYLVNHAETLLIKELENMSIPVLY